MQQQVIHHSNQAASYLRKAGGDDWRVRAGVPGVYDKLMRRAKGHASRALYLLRKLQRLRALTSDKAKAGP